MKKPKTRLIVIGCKHAWGNPIPEETEKYCSGCSQQQGKGDCEMDIMCGERCYIYKTARM